MATSMRSASSQRPRIHPMYEDFRPLMEPQEDPESKITHIHLSGFLKEQIRIVAVNSRGVLRVRGERLIGDNKWIRFLEELPVPESCDMAEVAANFEGGVLQIVMPTKIATTAPPSAPVLDINPQPEQPEIAAKEETENLRTECEARERFKEDEEYRKSVKGVYRRRLETERKVLVNVGVAVLVIAAMIGSVWISYSMIGSS